MGICNIPIKTDLKNKSYNTIQACKQCDTLILEFNIFDNSVMADLTGFTCDLRANKGDGKDYQIINDITVIVSTGKATIKCPSSLTQFAGKLLIELTFTDTINNLQKTTFDINIQVDKSVIANDDGSVPTVIITAIEEVNAILSGITDKVNEAKSINCTLTNTNNNAINTNSILNESIGNSNTAKTNCDTATGNLNAAVINANTTIDQLKNANTAYTDHINNTDIHVTKSQKDKWDSYEDKIIELTSIIDNYIYLDAIVTDDDGNNVTDDDNDSVLM